MILRTMMGCLLSTMLATFAIADEEASKKLAADQKAAADKQNIDRQAREKRFEESLRDVALVGHFTDSNKKPSDLNEEKYVIERVVKDRGDDWLFTVRIQYGKVNVPATLKIPVLWAGDTPVISVTDMAIPLLGKFNARVVIHGDQYAGTWSGAGHGGHLFGKIVKNPPADTSDAPAPSAPDKKKTPKPSSKRPTKE